MMMMSGRRNKFPFTATQWEELQHQALIFKYIVSGTPIPPHLLFNFNIKRNSNLQHVGLGWNCYMGRKVDPEPGRCRRTDGKKWRCSKQAYTDSKYCERHMHRGKNRSSKPVEQPSTATTTTMVANSSTATNQSLSLSLSSSHASAGLGIGLSLQEKTPHEHAFFSEPSGTTSWSFSGSSMDDDNSWQLMPLTMRSSSYSKQMNLLQLHSSKQNKHDDNEPCCVLASDIKCEMPINFDIREPKRTFHNFFDESPLPKHRDSSSSNSSSSASTVSQALNLFSSRSDYGG